MIRAQCACVVPAVPCLQDSWPIRGMFRKSAQNRFIFARKCKICSLSEKLIRRFGNVLGLGGIGKGRVKKCLNQIVGKSPFWAPPCSLGCGTISGMVRVRKPQPTLDLIFFSTPEQKVIRFLLSEPTTAFTPRVISSRLKGVRGLGGVDGIVKVLKTLETLRLVDFVDNNRAVRLRDDHPTVQVLKSFAAICDLEGLRALLEPLSQKVILYGSRADGTGSSDSLYDLCVVGDAPAEVQKTAEQHPLGKLIGVLVFTADEFAALESEDPALVQKLSRGIVLWDSSW